MAGFKRSQPGLRFSGEKVTPDEQDVYEIYSISQPGTTALWFGTAAVAGTSATGSFIVVNRYPDYPRNMNYVLVGTAAGMAGTFTVSGLDQFGSSVTETVATGTANNGGTVVGTQIFARFDSGTIQFGTAVGNGTTQLGLVPGTGCLFGLPVKVGSATDIVFASMVAGTGNITMNGGSINAGALVGTQASTPFQGNGYVRPSVALTGSQTINVWIKPTYVPDSIPVVSNLKQAA